MQHQMNKNEGLPFKSYSNQLVANLEDADAGVRDTAKKAVVDLFGYAYISNRLVYRGFC